MAIVLLIAYLDVAPLCEKNASISSLRYFTTVSPLSVPRTARLLTSQVVRRLFFSCGTSSTSTWG